VSWADEQAMPEDVLEIAVDLFREEQREIENATRRRS